MQILFLKNSPVNISYIVKCVREFALHVPSYSFEIKQSNVSSDIILLSSYLKSIVIDPAVVGHSSKIITQLKNVYLE